MRRLPSAVIVSGVIAVLLAIVFVPTTRVSASAWSSTSLAHTREWIAQSIEPGARTPVLRTLARPVRLAQSGTGGASSEPTVQTDKFDYAPGDTVNITGSGFMAGETVFLQVRHTDGTAEGGAGHEPWPVGADENGGFTSTWYVNPDDSGGSYFLLTADGFTSGLHAEATFTDANPSASLDQCANDPAPSPNTDGCSASASDWVNGNIGASKANYSEGDSIPYRLTFDNLSLVGSHTVTIEWDTTKSGKHAIDYLTTFSRTVATANPCLGVSGCNPGTFSTFAIAADTQVTGAGVTPVAGVFTLFGGTITATSAYSYPDGAGFAGDKSAQITITFTASVANPVLAWGGHIATRLDWGLANSAVSIPGSPYHTRLIDLDGSGGNQDRSLSAEAVIFPGSITIIKDATPNGATSFGFTASPSPLTNFSLVDDGTTANTQAFTNITTFQHYLVNESSIPAGWGFDSVSCSATSLNGGSYTTTTTNVDINMKEGENWTCTYLDSIRTGTLIVIKHVVNDNGGTAVAGDWSIHVKSGANEVSGSPAGGLESPGSSYGLTGGTYNVSESGGPSGYTFTGFSGDCDSSGNVTVVAGQTKTCTLTNDDQAPALHLRKVVTNDNGGTAVATDWTLTADGAGTNDLSGSTPVDSGAGLKADTFALSESGPTNYTASAWVCVGGTQGDATHITVGLGQSATCTITNDDNGPALHLRKIVTNDNGGTATVADFTLAADGTGSNDLSGTSPVDSGAGLKADTFALSETLSAAATGKYTASAWVCVGGTQGDSTHITVGLGQSATCTITNNDIAPQLHLRKVVTNNNGGTATLADFTLNADGAGANDLSGTSPVDSGTGLLADTFTLSETLSAAATGKYTGSAWVCVGGTQGDATHITVGVAQSATCTITNDDNAPGLHLRKIVTNDNGGTATVADFTLTADGTGANDISGTSPVDSGAGLVADTFALSETLSAAATGKYTASAWVCVGGTQGDATHVTVGVGQSVTCTITNDDIAPQLHLRKVVTNNNGGTATAANFTLTANGTGTNDLSGTSPLDSGAGLKADTWALSESGPAGYSASAWVCVGGTQNGSNITLGLAESATCTITNDDIAPKLHLRKVVVNNNGGTAAVTDFTLTANGTGTNDLSGTSPVDSGAGLLADTWALSETPQFGYTLTGLVCVGGTQNGTNITVGIGGEATCTFTNDDTGGTIIIKKISDPVNTGSFGFTTTGTGYNGFTLAGGGQNSQSGLNAGTYTATEGTQLGWILTGIGQDPADPNFPFACSVSGTGGSSGSGNLNTQTATISLKNGDTVTCVFENSGQGISRTQGFWATHSQLANLAWFGGTGFGHTFPGVANVTGIGDTTLCNPVTKNIDTLGKLMGGFWSDISKKSTNQKRSPLDQARMQLLQQLLAAELNASAFGSVPSGGTGVFATWEAAYCGTSQSAIQNALQGAASFNNSGDSSTFTPGTSADSKNARAIANLTFWDSLP